jgi:Ca2+-binding RTX toxin-like protein
MLIDSGIQTKINLTDAEEFLNQIIDFNNGTKGFVYSSVANLSTLPTALIMRMTDAVGNPTGAEISFVLPNSSFVGGTVENLNFIALSNGNFAVVYNDEAGNSPTPPPISTASRFQIYSASGLAIGSPTTISTAPLNGFTDVVDVIANPAGGFDVVLFEFGSQGLDTDLYTVSNNGVVSAEISAGTLQAWDIAFATSGARILGDKEVSASNTKTYSVDFPGSNPPTTYTHTFAVPLAPGQQQVVINSQLVAESATSAVAAIELASYAQGTPPTPSSPGTAPTVLSRSIVLVRFTDGVPAAQLLTSFTLPASTFGNDNFEDFIRLADGSFVVAFNNASQNTIGTTELWHISAAGVQLGGSELLNPVGAGAGAVQLTQLVDGRVMAGYSGITAGTGADLEVFRELFTVSGVSTTPSIGADSLTGTNGNDTINGLDGNDTIFGLGGNDTLDGGAGNDSIAGGAGNDVFVQSLGFDTITDFVAGGADDSINIVPTAALSDLAKVQGLTAQVGADTVITLGYNTVITLKNVTANALTATDFVMAAVAVNNAVNGTAAANSLTGTGGVDSMNGDAGADTVSGLAGNDTLLGGDGADYLFGDGDNDLLDGGNDNDILLAGAGDDIVIGGAGIDYVFGGTGSNVLSGGAGLDIIISEGTSDIMNGGADQNYYYRQANGTSQIFGGDALDILVGGTFASDDLFYGFGGGDFALGGAGNDELNGGLGDDILLGGDGNDTLDGGLGLNYLYADGVGNDLIRVNANLGGTQLQLIADFAAGGTDDVVQISGSTLTNFAGYQALLAGIGTVVNGNLVQNIGVGTVLTLGLGTANQTDIWFLGNSAYFLTAADFQFI